VPEHPTGRWPAFAVLGLLLATAAGAEEAGYEERLVSWGLTAQGRELEPDPQGKRIEEVLVAAEEVFSATDPWPNFLNIFHFRTREHVIRREVLLEVGESWDPTRVAETERNMRRLFIFAVVKVVPVKGRAGGIGLLVVTKDRWSLRTNSDFNLVGSLLQLLQVQATEQNFLGLNQQVVVDFLLRLDTLRISEQFIERRLFGTFLKLDETVGIILNRQTGKPEGSLASVLFGKPLVSLDQEWGFRAEGGWTIRTRRTFCGAQLCEAEGLNTRVPFAYDLSSVYGEASVIRSFGREWKSDLTAGVGGYGRRYVAPSSMMLTPDQLVLLEQKVLPRSEDATYLLGYFRLYKADFRVLKNIDSFELSEDYQIGPLIQAGARWAVPTFTTTHFVELGAAVRYRWLAAQNVLTASIAGAVRLVPGGPAVNRHVAGELLNVSPPFEGGRLVTRVLFDVIKDDLNRRLILLGGGNGLRGAPAESQSGQNLFLANIEYRTRPFELQTMYVGFVLFYDAGSAFDVTVNVTHTIGVGMRILLPQFNQETIRLDFGFVIGAPGQIGIDRLSASFGQVTDLKGDASPHFLDDPL
jgi:hypothetical protein